LQFHSKTLHLTKLLTMKAERYKGCMIYPESIGAFALGKVHESFEAARAYIDNSFKQLSKNKTMNEETVKPEQNISNKTWYKWTRLKKHGDVNLIMQFAQASQPVVIKALKYGHVKKAELTDKITAFYELREQGYADPNKAKEGQPEAEGNSELINDLRLIKRTVTKALNQLTNEGE